MQQSPMKLLRAAASLRITFPGIAALLAGVLVTYFLEGTSWIWLVVPLMMLAINLLAALCTDPRLNRSSGLLIFHVGLLGVVLLVACGRLSSFHGRVEIMEQQTFDAGEVQVVYSGPWHSAKGLSNVSFRQGNIEVRYAPELIRMTTTSHVFPDDVSRTRVFGDNVPFQVAGYEFYTTSNKGFAALLTWTPASGPAQQGVVFFPSFPLQEWNQTNLWISPHGQRFEFELLGTPRLPDTGELSLDHALTERLSLEVNGSMDARILSIGGESVWQTERLRLDDIRMWMGYEIRADPITPWTFLTAIIGILGMGWHFLANSQATASRSGSPSIPPVFKTSMTP